MDLRYIVLVLIKFLKSPAAIPWSWDPFNLQLLIHHRPNSFKLWLLALLVLLFPVTSIQFRQWRLRLRFGDVSASLTLSLLASLVFPQQLFWYAYPLIISLSFSTGWLRNLFKLFLRCLRSVLNGVPDCWISVHATLINRANTEPQNEIIRDIEAHYLQQEEPVPEDVIREIEAHYLQQEKPVPVDEADGSAV